MGKGSVRGGGKGSNIVYIGGDLFAVIFFSAWILFNSLLFTSSVTPS